MTQETQAGQNQEQEELQPPKTDGAEDNVSTLPAEEQGDEGTLAEQASVSTGAPSL